MKRYAEKKVKKMNDILEKVKQSNNKFVGYKQLMRESDCGEIQYVVLADDTDVVMKDKVTLLCEAKGFPLHHVPTMKQLGEFAGIHVRASVVSILNDLDRNEL